MSHGSSLLLDFFYFCCKSSGVLRLLYGVQRKQNWRLKIKYSYLSVSYRSPQREDAILQGLRVSFVPNLEACHCLLLIFDASFDILFTFLPDMPRKHLHQSVSCVARVVRMSRLPYSLHFIGVCASVCVYSLLFMSYCEDHHMQRWALFVF